MTPNIWNNGFSLALLVVILSMATMTSSSKRTSRRNWRGGASDLESMAGDEGGVCELEVSCKNRDGLPINLPVKGPKGPSGKPGTPGLPGKPGPAGQPGSQMFNLPRVAFFVGLTNNMKPVKKNTGIVFDRILTNVGNAYNPKTGRFTAPFNGTYQFGITASAQGRRQAAVEIVLNSAMVATVWAESLPIWGSSTTSLILTLKTGDQVWAVVPSRAPYLHGYMYTSFSGHCLFQSV